VNETTVCLEINYLITPHTPKLIYKVEVEKEANINERGARNRLRTASFNTSRQWSNETIKQSSQMGIQRKKARGREEIGQAGSAVLMGTRGQGRFSLQSHIKM